MSPHKKADLLLTCSRDDASNSSRIAIIPSVFPYSLMASIALLSKSFILNLLESKREERRLNILSGRSYCCSSFEYEDVVVGEDDEVVFVVESPDDVTSEPELLVFTFFFLDEDVVDETQFPSVTEDEEVTSSEVLVWLLDVVCSSDTFVEQSSLLSLSAADEVVIVDVIFSVS